MGSLSDFDLPRMMTDFGCRYFVETGTGTGRDVEFAARFPFEHVYSIEATQKLAIQVAFRHARNLKMTILHNRNERGLREVLAEIPGDAPVIFWMNSHPAKHDLERELRLVASLRDTSRDVILIDDRRIYEDGDNDDGACPPDQRADAALRDLGFVAQILGGTHQISRLTQGYLCAFPVTPGDGNGAA